MVDEHPVVRPRVGETDEATHRAPQPERAPCGADQVDGAEDRHDRDEDDAQHVRSFHHWAVAVVAAVEREVGVRHAEDGELERQEQA
eukprot:scaffold10999_cov63-Phaeocystis_antarctica.AAC.3